MGEATTMWKQALLGGGAFAGLFVVATGCGSDDPPAGVPSSAPDARAPVIPTRDAGRDVDVDPTANPFYGLVDVVVGPALSASGIFFDASPIYTCTQTVFPNCKVYECPVGESVKYATMPKSAGTLSIAGGTPKVTLPLTQAERGDYRAEDSAAAASFGPDSTVTFSATGGDIPAFSDSVVVPAAPTLSFDGSETEIDRAAAFTVGFEGGTMAEYFVNLYTTSAQISCHFTASDGSTITIRPELLGRLPAGAGQLRVYAENRKFIDVGAYSVELRGSRNLRQGPVEFK